MTEKNLEFQTTLVRYNNPTLVIKHDDKKSEKDVRKFAFKFLAFSQGIFVFSRSHLKAQKVRKMVVQHREIFAKRAKKLKRF